MTKKVSEMTPEELEAAREKGRAAARKRRADRPEKKRSELTPEELELERERDRRWRAANPEKQREASQRFRADHPEKKRSELTPEELELERERDRRWRTANPEKKRQSDHKQYLANPEPYKQRARKWEAENPEKSKESKWKSKGINLTYAQFLALVKKQHGLCAICKMAVKLCPDHCHSTGTIRGLLCSKCNTGIGLLRHDPRLLESAIAYLTSSACMVE